MSRKNLYSPPYARAWRSRGRIHELSGSGGSRPLFDSGLIPCLDAHWPGPMIHVHWESGIGATLSYPVLCVLRTPAIVCPVVFVAYVKPISDSISCTYRYPSILLAIQRHWRALGRPGNGYMPQAAPTQHTTARPPARKPLFSPNGSSALLFRPCACMTDVPADTS